MIKLNKINKSFGEGLSEVHVLKNLSLDVNTGEFVAVMGKSGCGKTTLLNILGTLENADSGEYFLGDRNMSTLSEKEKCKLRRTKIAIIYQSYNLVEDLKIGVFFFVKSAVYTRKNLIGLSVAFSIYGIKAI